MTNWSPESLRLAEKALHLAEGTWYEKIACALNAAIEQNKKEEQEAMNKRLHLKIQELECHRGGA
jgi:CO dehydrogenase nickel-insertion accessory protein CooC1